jgi:hypothetical protein
MWSTTIGEANSRDGRSGIWATAVSMQALFLALALCMAYAATRSTQMKRDPWRLVVSLAWAPVAMLGTVIWTNMNLSLPLAPVGARFVFERVYLLAAFVVFMLGLFCAAYGHASQAVVLAGAVAVVIAGLLVFWLWVDRSYRAQDIILPV